MPQTAIWSCSKQPRNMTETWDVRCTGFHRARNFPFSANRAGESMINVKRLGYALLIGIVTMTAQTHDTTSEYVSPSEAVPRGKTPKMQVELLNPGEPTKSEERRVGQEGRSR